MDLKELTASEIMVMKTIWDADHEMALAEITKTANERFGKGWAPQTVSTFLAKLCQKDYIRMKRSGRTIVYEILVPEAHYQTWQARKFVNFWNGGSVPQFVAALYKDEPATKAELDELRRLIDELDK